MQSGQGRSIKNTILFAGALLVVAFLAGYLPSYIRAKRLERELNEARQQISMAGLRDMAALAYVQASQKNYGLAAGTTAQFFERAQAVANQTSESSIRKAVEDLLTSRDKVTSELAKGEPGSANDLQDLFVKTRQITEGVSQRAAR